MQTFPTFLRTPLWKTALLVASTAVLGACGGGSGGGGGSAVPAVTGISVTPATVTMQRGSTQQLTATAAYDNGTQKDATNQVLWTTSNATIATVSSAGLVSGVTIGSVNVSAKLGTLTQVVSVTVNPALTSVTVAPAAVTFPLTRTLQLAAVAWFEDKTNAVVTGGATWTSSAPSAMTVATGLLTPAGSAGASSTITASFQGKSGTATATLSAAASAIGPGIDTDPLIAEQWHLRNTGQTGYAANAGIAGNDIAAALTYELGFGGMGVKVAVVDSGLEIAHEDLSANVVPGSWNFTNGTNDPTTTVTTGDHGTSVAGLIAAVRGNGVGGMGVAPLAQLNGYNVIEVPTNATTGNFVASLGAGNGVGGPRSDDVWIFNQSYGISPTLPSPLDLLVAKQYEDGVTNLRAGLGAIYVKSAGNGFKDNAPADCASANLHGVTCENASMDPNNTLFMNIVVGALNASGTRSSYSTAGSAIWISAFGGEYGNTCGGGACPGNLYDPAMVTTDQSGCAAGYSVTGASSSAFNAGGPPNTSCNYTNGFNGTSSAAPVTSGVVALILEANPSLTWRDVKHILAFTAYQTDASIAPVTIVLSNGSYTAELGWTTNAAGYRFHNWYGFGMIDADTAVAMASTYAPGQLGKSQDIPPISGTVPASAAIPDNSTTGVTGTAAVAKSLVVEAVMLQVDTDHTFLGDLAIELSSPSGTKSIVLNTANGYSASTGTANLLLASNAFYGEASAGTWTLKIVDGAPVNTGNLLAWRIIIFGH